MILSGIAAVFFFVSRTNEAAVLLRELARGRSFTPRWSLGVRLSQGDSNQLLLGYYFRNDLTTLPDAGHHSSLISTMPPANKSIAADELSGPPTSNRHCINHPPAASRPTAAVFNNCRHL